MSGETRRSYFKLPYPENLIRTIDAERVIKDISDDQVLGLQDALY